MTSYFSDIVLLENRQSSLVLERYTHKDVEAFAVRANEPNFWWRRLPLDSSHCVYQNMGTGCLLGHYLDKSMRARDHDAYNEHCQWMELNVDGRPSQHWQLVSVHRTQRYKRQGGAAVAVAFDENRKYAIVAFRNRETSQVLDHSATSDLVEGEALTSAVAVSKSCQWYRIPICDSIYAYKNVRSGKVLKHCEEDDGCETTVQALMAITHLASHQWQEVDITTDDEDDDRSFITLQNRRSRRNLHHCHKTLTHMCEYVDRDGWDSDPKFHWELVWVRRHPKNVLIDDNHVSPWSIWWRKNKLRTLTRSDIKESFYTPPDWSFLQPGAKQR